MGNGLTLNTVAVDVPPKSGVKGLVGVVKRVALLPRVQLIEISPTGVMVQRYTYDWEEVVPEDVSKLKVDDAVAETVLDRVEMHECDGTVHDAFNLVAKLGHFPVAVVTSKRRQPLRDHFSRDNDMTHVYGVPVHYVLHDEYHDQCVVLGGQSFFAEDVVVGVSVSLEGK